MKKIFISAGDISGDLHAAKLIRELKMLIPDLEIVGIGGENLIKEGLIPIAPFEKLSVVGFWEVAKKYNFFRELINRTKNILKNENIDAFIPVDYPGFNISILPFARKCGIPIIYYIAPQLWAWGKNRAKKLARNVDKLMVVFKFEEQFFSQFGIDTTWVGHPLIDEEIFQTDFCNYERQNLIAILPGSRKQEIKNHSKLINQTLKLLHLKLPDYSFGIAKSDNLSNDLYTQMIENIANCHMWNDSRKLMINAKAGIIKTGTSTLEAALCCLPYIMFYRTSAINYFIGKNLVNLKYLSLVNIILNKPIITEFVQMNANSYNIVNGLVKLLKNEINYNELQEQFKMLREKLGDKGASKRAAKVIFEMIK